MRINQEIRTTKSKSNERYLIVAFSLDNSQIALTDLTRTAPRKPIALALSTALEKIRTKEWELLDHNFPDFLYLPDEQLDEKWKKMRDEAMHHLASLTNDVYAIDEYLFGSANGVLSELIERSGKSRCYIHNKLARWFRFGGMNNALLPHYDNCGRSHQLPAVPTIMNDGSVCIASKPGRRTRYGAPFRAVTQKDFKNIEIFSKKIPRGTQVQLIDLYTKFICDFMSVSVAPKASSNREEIHQELIPFPREQLISPRSFKYYLNLIVDDLAWIKARVGNTTYDRNHRGKPGLARAGLRGAGQRYEIDATIADVYIKYPYSTDELLSCGRPVIYFVIDTYSGMIVGFHVCFDGPNWNGAAQALFNAFENKVDFCRRWGIEIDASDWPCEFICYEIVWDRGGENSDNNLESVLKGRIGIRIMKLVAYHRGDCKGTVEKTFDIVIPQTITFDPGKVEKYPIKEIQHPSRKPLLEFDDFMRKIIKVIIHENNFSRKEAHNFQMESTNVGYTRRDIWNHFMKSVIPAPVISTDRIRCSLMPEADATVTERGVYFRGLYYSNTRIEKMLWLDRAKNSGRYKIKIRYSDITTNHVLHHLTETDEIIKLDLQDRCEAYKNQTWANVLHRLEFRKHEQAIQDAVRFNNKALLELDLAELDKVTSSRNRKLKQSNAKNSAPGIKDRKDIMIASQRNQQASELEKDMLNQFEESDSTATHVETFSEQDLTDTTIIYK